MLPTLAQPLASIASGAALSSASGAASPAPRPIPGADAFVGVAKSVELLGAAGPSTASRARSTGPGYAAAASAAGSSATKKNATSGAKAKSTAAKSASAKTASTAAKKTGPLAFLEDRTLSVEEKLMRLLAYLNDKWDKDLDKKMKEIEAGQQKATAPAAAATSAAAPKKKSSGVLGSIGAIVKTASGFFPALGVAMEALKNPTVRAALSKLGGPVLAAAASALGYPALAPLLLKYGPTIVDVAAGVATSLDAGGTSAGGGTPASGSSGSGPSTASAATGGSSPSATGMNDSELRLKLMEIERIQNLQKEMFSLVSNILRAGHETRMNVVQNIR